jgi:glutaredoxin
MSARRMRSVLAAVCVALVVVAGVACRRGHGSQGQPAAAGDPAEPAAVVKDDTEGLLLTWIDDKGDFHVETKVADVPLVGRDAVRIVDPAKDETAAADRVTVVDLRQTRADGTYLVRWMSRADFEQMAVARREKAGPTLAQSAAPGAAGAPGAPAGSDQGGAQEPGSGGVAAHATVIIYGAEWCGACHDAAKYLRRKGIPYIEKDVEKDPAAAREMQAKLAKNGLRAGSIPVIDVRGHVMVGFNAQQIDGALGQTL